LYIFLPGTYKMPLLTSFYSVQPDDWLLVSPSGLRRQKLAKENIRQWILRELLTTYRYPKEWLTNRIKLLQGDKASGGLFGLSFLTSNDQEFLVVSVADLGHGEEAEKSLKTFLLTQHYAGFGICTDGSEIGTRFIRRRFDSEACDYIHDCEPYSVPTATSESMRFISSIKEKSERNRGHLLTPLTERVENVFFEVHSHIRDIDGLHADEALDELCKVLYIKLYDEEITAKSNPYSMQRWLYGSNEEFATTIRKLYEEAGEYDTRVFRLKIPEYQRSRGVFSKPIRLSTPALVKAVETLQEYNLTCSSIDVKGRAFQKVLAPTIRAGMGQYFTPDPVIKFMGKVAQPSLLDLILDPFCGSAHFLTICLRLVQEKCRSESGKRFHEFAFGKLHGIEKSDRMVRVAMTDMRLHGDGHSNIRCTDSLLNFYNYPDIQQESFDLVLTNPPFGSLLGGEAIAQLGEFDLTKGHKKVPLEILGLERCLQFLRPGGRLGIVLPDGIVANRNTRYVRDWLETQAKIRAIISLPIETFTPFGANIKTSILFVRKWRKGEAKSNSYSIFLARVDNIGYDASGKSKESSELDKIAEEAAAFIEREGW
jgi:type I restriction enzyme M protein